MKNYNFILEIRNIRKGYCGAGGSGKDARLPFPQHESEVVLGLEKHAVAMPTPSSSHTKLLAFL